MANDSKDTLETPLIKVNPYNKVCLAFNCNCVSSEMTDYIIDMLKDTANAIDRTGFDKKWKDDNGVEHPVYGHLFHANSVSTSLDYIKSGFMYSRKYGEKYRKGIQTKQKSDGIDKCLGIYNDIFFDNSDIAYRLYKYNAYGPVLFVFDIEALRGKNVRITKCNPIKAGVQTATYSSLFYTSEEEISAAVRNAPDNMFFLNDFGHHVTLFNTPKLALKGNLKEIILEKCYDGSGKENELKDLILQELRNSKITNVKVAVRPGPPVPEEDRKSSAPVEELWRFPE